MQLYKISCIHVAFQYSWKYQPWKCGNSGNPRAVWRSADWLTFTVISFPEVPISWQCLEGERLFWGHLWVLCFWASTGLIIYALETNLQLHIYTKTWLLHSQFLKIFANYFYARDIILSCTKSRNVFQLHDSYNKQRKHLVFQQKSLPLTTGELKSKEVASKVEDPPLMLPLFSWRQFVDDKGLSEPIMWFPPVKRAPHGTSQIVFISSLASIFTFL